MRIKFVFVFILFATVVPVRADTCGSFVFPNPGICSVDNCRMLINVNPRGIVRLLPDNRFGPGGQLGINFGEESVFQLGDDNPRLHIGSNGGIEATRTGPGTPLNCRPLLAGLFPYAVDMGSGGWLRFSTNNRFQLNPNNFFVLGAGSKINGRLDIESQSTVSLTSTGEMAVPNVDISAPDGIRLSAQGDVLIGDLQNQDMATDNPGVLPHNLGIEIIAEGNVETGIVDGNGEFTITASGDINIERIENADSISLTVSPPEAGVITIGGRQTTDNPVVCAPTDDCNGFEVDDDPNNGNGEETCEPVNEDGSANECAGGGAADPVFVLLCAVLFYRRSHRLFFS